eukprot:scaffold5284_cov42-Phaeocystis_antarctica.AAC.2
MDQCGKMVRVPSYSCMSRSTRRMPKGRTKRPWPSSERPVAKPTSCRFRKTSASVSHGIPVSTGTKRGARGAGAGVEVRERRQRVDLRDYELVDVEERSDARKGQVGLQPSIRPQPSLLEVGNDRSVPLPGEQLHWLVHPWYGARGEAGRVDEHLWRREEVAHKWVGLAVGARHDNVEHAARLVVRFEEGGLTHQGQDAL